MIAPVGKIRLAEGRKKTIQTIAANATGRERFHPHAAAATSAATNAIPPRTRGSASERATGIASNE